MKPEEEQMIKNQMIADRDYDQWKDGQSEQAWRDNNTH